eukprot:223692_1
MSSRAPISGDQTLRDNFSKAESDLNFGYLTIKINLNSNQFEVEKYASKENLDDIALFKQMVSECVDKEHRYLIIRDPTKDSVIDQSTTQSSDDSSTKSKLNLYILIHYAPDLSPVKQRMMYAASRPSLKAFLGQAAFSEDYHCSTKNELNLQRIVDMRTLHHKIDFRSDAEIQKEEASLESVATSAKSAVMKSLPIDIKESATTSINNYKSESTKCVFLTLTKGTQGIEGEEKKENGLAEIRELLNETDPKYILFWYAKTKRDNVEEEKQQLGNKRVFGYYCPDKADRKLRFTYSTCKTNVMAYCRSIGLEFYAKVEVTSLNDFNSEYMDYHIFPVKEKKETFAMPKGPKSRNNKKGKKRKKISLDDL